MPTGNPPAPYRPRRPVWPWVVGGVAVLGVIGVGVMYSRRAQAAQPTTMPSNGNGMAPSLAQEGELTVENVAATYQIYYDPATNTWWHQWQSTPLSRAQGSGRQQGFQSVAAALADIERQMVQAGMTG